MTFRPCAGDLSDGMSFRLILIDIVLSCFVKWEKGIAKQFRVFGFAVSILSGIENIHGQEFRLALVLRQQRVWESVQESLRTAPSKGAKFGLPSSCSFVKSSSKYAAASEGLCCI